MGKHNKPDHGPEEQNTIEPEIVEDTATETAVSENEADAQADAQAALAELSDKLLRTQAEYQNYRKRMSREISDARRVGVVDTLEVFLPLFDHFGMAVQAAEKSDNVQAIRQGLAMIADEYAKALDELGVKKFDAVGSKFDHNRHDAVAQEPSDTIPEGVVSRQWNCGYAMGDRVLRPARVVVSSGPAKAVEEAE